MKRFESFVFPADDDDMYDLMFKAFQAGISNGTVPAPDEELWEQWLHEDVPAPVPAPEGDDHQEEK